MWSFGKPRTAAALWTIAALAPYGLSWVAAGSHGMVQPDETLFVQIALRMLSGETLYRDIFLSTTPLSAYLTLAFVGTLGAEVLVVRAVALLVFAVSALLAVRIFRTLAPQPGPAPLLLLALCVYARPMSLLPLYAALADFFLLACLFAVLRWDCTGSRRTLVLAGICAGLSFTSKQNVGAYALAALLCAVAYLERRKGALAAARAAGVTLLSFGAAVTAVLLPVLLTGAAADFVACAFANKAAYLRLAHAPYWAGIAGLFQMAAGLPAAPAQQAMMIYWQAGFLLPPLAVSGVLLCLIRDAGQRRQASVLLIFCCAALLGLYPMADINHLVSPTPVVLVAIAWAWTLFGVQLPVRRILTYATAAWLAAGFLYLSLHPWIRIATGNFSKLALPHVRFALVRADSYQELGRFTRELARAIAPGARVFIVSPSASVYYLTANVRNPTPYDYVDAVTLRPAGERELILAAEAGKIGAVCIDNLYAKAPYFAPKRIFEFEQFVREHYQQGPRAGFCSIYIEPGAKGSRP